MSADAVNKAAQIEFSSPRVLTLGTVVILNALGMFSALPVLAAALAISVLSHGIVTLLVLLAAIALIAFFPPLCFENPYLARKISRRLTPEAGAAETFLVQLQFTPRLRQGLRGAIEDADDVGYLSLTDTGLVYHGDAVRLTIPFSQLTDVQSKNIGWRGLYWFGGRTLVAVQGLADIELLEFTDRSASSLAASRIHAQRLYDGLRKRMA